MSVKGLQSYREAVTDVTGGTSLPHERLDGGVLRADHRAWSGWLWFNKVETCWNCSNLKSMAEDNMLHRNPADFTICHNSHRNHCEAEWSAVGVPATGGRRWPSRIARASDGDVVAALCRFWSYAAAPTTSSHSKSQISPSTLPGGSLSHALNAMIAAGHIWTRIPKFQLSWRPRSIPGTNPLSLKDGNGREGIGRRWHTVTQAGKKRIRYWVTLLKWTDYDRSQISNIITSKCI